MRNVRILAVLFAAASIAVAITACGQSIVRPTEAGSTYAAGRTEQPSPPSTAPRQVHPVATISPGSNILCSPPPDWEADSRDFIDFVRLNGIQYVAQSTGVGQIGRTPREGDLGPVFARVRARLYDGPTDGAWRRKNGDAAFLKAGTPLYRVKGNDPAFWLAACREGRLMLYEADTNPRAKVGGDLLDIAGKVRYIGVNSGQDGTTELAAIRQREHVSRLVGIVAKAPVDQSFRPGDAGRQHFIAFHLKDGTTVTRAYWPRTGELYRGIMLPADFARAIERATRADGK